MHNRFIVNTAFATAGVVVDPVIETNSILTLGLSVLEGDVCSIMPGALVAELRAYGELEAVPLCGPEVLTAIGFMFAFTDRPTQAVRVALELANNPEWLAQLRSHTGALQPLQTPQS